MTSKVLGSILIVAGTAIGGGMLAMPIISSGVGFPFITLVMFLVWASMCYTSLLLVEAYRFNNPDDGLNTMTYKYLGKSGSWITGISMLSLMYALVSAYIAGGSDILQFNINNWIEGEISPQVAALLFTLIFGGIVGLGAKVVDVSTKWIFIVKIVFLLLIITVMSQHVKLDYLNQLPIAQAMILSSIPVIFTSFGFHIVVPSLVRYLNGDIKSLKTAFIWGSLLPLAVYIIWQLSILGSIQPEEFYRILQESKGLEGMIKAVSSTSNSHWIQVPINVFTAAAILTSFLGVALALFDYIRDLTKKKITSKPFMIFLFTFIPPLLFALYYPKGFILALGYAAVFVVITSLFIPILMYLKVKAERKEKISGLQKVLFALIGSFGLFILLIQVFISIGKLPVLD